MTRRHDPLRDPAPLIRRVYAYIAYRIGDGPDAEDLTHDVFERALRYRASYDPAKGKPLHWLLGIARRVIDDRAASRLSREVADPGRPASAEMEADALRRLDLHVALARLGGRDRDLLALRYGADLTTRQMAEILGLSTNAVEVALHRARARLRVELTGEKPHPGEATARARTSPAQFEPLG
jgi:RNA polymerase sigma-70 factor (ECF subfamily)